MVKLSATTRVPPDARALGAKCDECPLVAGRPVPSRLANPERGPRLVLLGEGPGRDEDVRGEPFVGVTGKERLDPALREVGLTRDEVHIANATMCVPLYDMTPAQWRAALTACRLRLHRELVALPTRTVFAMGEKAQLTLTGRAGITKWMGYPLDGTVWKPDGKLWKPLVKTPLPGPETIDFRPWRVLSSVHPAYTLPHRDPAYTPVFVEFLRRAKEIADGTWRDWTWPEVLFNGPKGNASDERLIEEIDRMEAEETHLALDTETDRLDVMTAIVLNVGIASRTRAVSIYWHTSGETLRARLKALVENPRMAWDFWNAAYDLLILSERLGLRVAGRVDDWMLAKSVYAARLPNKLGLASVFEFPIPRWKSEFKQGTDSQEGVA